MPQEQQLQKIATDILLLVEKCQQDKIGDGDTITKIKELLYHPQPAEVDAEEFFNKKKNNEPKYYNSLYAIPFVCRKKVIEAMHEFSDLQLVKAMEEKEKEMLEFMEWAISVIKEYQRGRTYTVNPPLDCTKTFTIKEIYQLFLADKKKGEGDE